MEDMEEQDITPQEVREEPAGPGRASRHLALYGGFYATTAVWLGVTAVIAGVCTLIGVKQHSAGIDGRFRDRAVEASVGDVARRTHGEINLIKKPNASYSWNSSNHELVVQLKVGSCSFVDGKFASPTRPKSPTALGDLHIRAPHDVGAGYYPVYADVSMRDSNLYKKLEASALAHCVAGDSRKLQYLYAPDGA